MEVSYEIFNNPATIAALRKIYTFDGYQDMKSAYRVKKVCDILEKELRDYLELVKKADTPEKKEELHKQVIEMKWDRLTKEDLTGIKFSPAELGAMEFISDIAE